MKKNNIEFKLMKLPDLMFFQEGPGVRKHQFTNTGVKLLNGGNINNNQLDLTTTDKFISKEEAYGRYKHFLVDEGDLVIASSGIVVSKFNGKIAFVDKSHLPLCMNTSTIRFKVLDKTQTDIKYFYFFLKQNIFKNQIQRLITGSAQLNFGPTHLKKIKIPIPYKDSKPDLLAQKRIAKILSHTETLIAKRKKSIQMLDDFVKATFLDMFGDSVRNEKGWPTRTIEELVKNERYAIKRGPFGGALKKEIFVEDGYLVYEQYHALNNDFSFARYFISEDKFQELKAFEVKPGDIIISCSGVYLGKLAVVPENAISGIINQALLKISLDNDIITNSFFYYLFTHKNFKRKFFGSQRGGGIPNFPPMSEFKKFKFIYPPFPLQQQFSKIVEKTEALKKQFEQSLQELQNLYGSLSQRAFKGELDLSRLEIEEMKELEQKVETMDKEIEQEEMKRLNLFEFIKEKFNDKKFTFEELKKLIEKDGFDYEYEKIKEEIFHSIDNEKISQVFDEQTGSIKLGLKQ